MKCFFMCHMCQYSFIWGLKCHILTNLEEACENVELKHRNIVIAIEVDGGFEGHGLQAWADGMHFMKALSEDFPWHYRPARK